MKSHGRRTQPVRHRQSNALGYTPVNPGVYPERRTSYTHPRPTYYADTAADDENNSNQTSSSEVAKPKIPKRHRRCLWFFIWWKAAAAALAVMGAAVASFVTLHPYQGRPLPEWPYYITLGALLSTYSVILRTAASFLLAEGLAQLMWRWYDQDHRPLFDMSLHDEATRGPIGAGKLLWKLKFLPKTWQWLGCVLIPITLLTGPFTQQVLQYNPCSVLDHSSTQQATFSRAAVFFGQGVRQDLKGNTLALAEQAAFNAGLYNPIQAGVVCDSGNCTSSKPFSSIGFCSQCDDISSRAKITVAGQVGDSTASNLTTSIPGGLDVQIVKLASVASNVIELAAFGLPPPAIIYNIRDPFQVVIGMQGGSKASGCDDIATNQTWRCQGYGAANCRVYPCVRTYSANMTNGVLSETILDEQEHFGSGTWPDLETVFSTLQESCLTDDERDLLRRIGYTVDGQTPWIPYDMTNGGDGAIGFNDGKKRSFHNQSDGISDTEVGAFENKTIDRGCMFAVDKLFHQGLLQYISESFSGTLTGRVSGTYTGPKTLNGLNGTQLMQFIYNYGNFSFEHTQSLFQNMTISLTNHMRTTPNGGSVSASRPATGNVYITKTCVNVQWAWLSLPVALAFLTLVWPPAHQQRYLMRIGLFSSSLGIC